MDEKIKNKIVQTYAEDMAKVIENDKEGLIKKIIHGEEEHEKEKRNFSPESRRNKFFMLAGLLFIALGFVALFYFFSKREAPTVPVEQQFTPLIFNDKSVFIEIRDFSKDKIAQTVLNEVNGTLVKNGGVEGIYLTNNKKIAGLREFIALIKGNFVPGDINFVSDNFLLGVVKGEDKPASPDASQGGSFFMLIKTRSLSDIFDSLRAWENKMFSDLHGFFGIDISGQTKYLLTKNFENGVVQNKNARILYGQDQKIIMMYVFANDTSVIVTDTETAAREIMLRLASSQIKK